MPSIRWNEHSAHLTDSVSELYRNSEFTDCVLDVEGESIEVHKTILAACSPYFKKLLKNHHAITTIPINDVKYQDLKLILDFIYYGEVDVPDIDVASLIKTAELMKMTSLKLCVSHCFQEMLSCNNTSEKSVNNSLNLIRNDSKNLLEEQVPHNLVLYLKERTLNSKSQNIHLQLVGNPKTEYLNDFQDVSEKLNKDHPKGSIPKSCESFKELTKENEENINDELFPLTFVAVPPVSLKNEQIEERQDDRRWCFDTDLNDPLGVYSGIFNVTKEKNINEKCTFQSEPQVKRESTDENDVPKSVVLIADQLTHSCHELTNVERNLFVACKQERGMENNSNIIFGNTLGSEGCAAEDLEIQLESICEVSGVDLKEEKISETDQCTDGDDTEISPLEPEANYNTRGSAFTQIVFRKEGKEVKVSDRNSPRDFNSTKIITQQTVQRDCLQMRRSELHVRNGQTGNVPTHSTKRRNFSCNNCWESFKKVCHLETHTRRKTYKCEFCKKTFYDKDELTIHLESHTVEKHSKCEICKKLFYAKHNRSLHARTHTGDKSFECEVCDKSFYRKDHLIMHVRSHTGEKLFQCVICKKSFYTKDHLRRHILTHTGEKLFECEICQKSFSHKYHLTTHFRTHTGEKPFQCVICQRSFCRKGDLTAHVRTHSGEKLFQCEICKKWFCEKRTLRKHVVTCIDKKPFESEICGKRQ